MENKHIIIVLYNGNENYTGNTSTQKLTIKEETKKTTEVNSVDFNQYSEYSPNFGYYKTIETHDEMALIETSNGNYYIFAGDGAYTYGGRDSQGVIQFGEFVGDYQIKVVKANALNYLYLILIKSVINCYFFSYMFAKHRTNKNF